MCIVPRSCFKLHVSILMWFLVLPVQTLSSCTKEPESWGHRATCRNLMGWPPIFSAFQGTCQYLRGKTVLLHLIPGNVHSIRCPLGPLPFKALPISAVHSGGQTPRTPPQHPSPPPQTTGWCPAPWTFHAVGRR